MWDWRPGRLAQKGNVTRMSTFLFMNTPNWRWLPWPPLMFPYIETPMLRRCFHIWKRFHLWIRFHQWKCFLLWKSFFNGTVSFLNLSSTFATVNLSFLTYFRIIWNATDFYHFKDKLRSKADKSLFKSFKKIRAALQ